MVIWRDLNQWQTDPSSTAAAADIQSWLREAHRNKKLFFLCLNYPQSTLRPVLFLARTEIWHDVQCFTSQTFRRFFLFDGLSLLGEARQYCHYWKLRSVFVYSLLRPNPRVFSCREREPHVLHKTNFIFTLFTGRRGTGSTLMMEELPQGSSFASLLLHIALNDI